MATTQDATLLRRAGETLHASPAIMASYDRASDTTMLHFFGKPRAAVSVPLESRDDGVFVRIDRETDEVVGLQIEGFVADFILRYPQLAELLEVAKLRGIDPTEASAIAANARMAGVRKSMVHWLESMAAD